MVQLVSIPQLARSRGLNRFTLLRRLLAVHARVGGDWLVPVGTGQRRRRVLVNLPMLEAMAPGLFAPDRRTKPDVESLISEIRTLRRTVMAQGARLRELERAS